MKIRFLEERPVSCDGFGLRRYYKNCIYTVGPDITETSALFAVNKGWAEWIAPIMAVKCGDAVQIIKGL